jgi:hypothetical protein
VWNYSFYKKGKVNDALSVHYLVTRVVATMTCTIGKYREKRHCLEGGCREKKNGTEEGGRKLKAKDDDYQSRIDYFRRVKNSR